MATPQPPQMQLKIDGIKLWEKGKKEPTVKKGIVGMESDPAGSLVLLGSTTTLDIKSGDTIPVRYIAEVWATGSWDRVEVINPHVTNILIPELGIRPMEKKR